MSKWLNNWKKGVYFYREYVTLQAYIVIAFCCIDISKKFRAVISIPDGNIRHP